jgi:bla regulator protein BlaR1
MMAIGALSIFFERIIAQTVSKPSDGVRNMSFDVVSIRQSKSDKGFGAYFTADEYRATYIPLQFFVVYAYNLVGRELQMMSGGKLLPGAPGWMLSDKYNIRAKISPSDQQALQRLSLDQQSDQKRLMIRSMLTDRFKLRVRQEAKPGPCYALVVDKNGPKIKKVAAPSDPTSHEGDAFGGPGFIRAKSAPLSQLVFYLANQLNCPIPDRTGLTGNLAFSMQYSVDQGPGATSSAEALPDLFTAISEQLGLRLVPVTIPIPSITIEHVERPSEN